MIRRASYGVVLASLIATMALAAEPPKGAEPPKTKAASTPLLLAGEADAAPTEDQTAQEPAQDNKNEAEAERRLSIAEDVLALGNGAAALKLVDQLTDLNPDTVSKGAILKYRILLAQNDSSNAREFGEEFVQAHQDDASTLFALGGAILDETPKLADLDLAEKIALRLKEITLEEDSDAWELLATIYSREGKHDEALGAVAKMAALAKDDETKQTVQFCKIRTLLKKNDVAAANALAEQTLSAIGKNVGLLEYAAHLFLDEPDAGKELLDMADRFVSRALEAADNDEAKGELRPLKLRVLLKKKDPAAAKALAEQMVAAANNDSAKLAEFITPLMEGNRVSVRELAVAEHLVSRANTVKDGKDWLLLAFLSQINLRKGKLDEAIQLQIEAVGNAPDDEIKKGTQERLDDLQTIAAAVKTPGKSPSAGGR